MLVAPSRFRRLCQARDLLADLDSAVTIHHAARAAGLLPYHFIRRFEALFGATPRQFRIQRRNTSARRAASWPSRAPETTFRPRCSPAASA